MATAIVQDNSVAAWLGYSNASSTGQESIELGGNDCLQLSLEARHVHPRISCFNAGGSKFQPYAVLKLLSNDACLGKTEW
jgi:hypothetical protein